jgi:hypothetical protein
MDRAELHFIAVVGGFNLPGNVENRKSKYIYILFEMYLRESFIRFTIIIRLLFYNIQKDVKFNLQASFLS